MQRNGSHPDGTPQPLWASPSGLRGEAGIRVLQALQVAFQEVSSLYPSSRELGPDVGSAWCFSRSLPGWLAQPTPDHGRHKPTSALCGSWVWMGFKKSKNVYFLNWEQWELGFQVNLQNYPVAKEHCWWLLCYFICQFFSFFGYTVKTQFEWIKTENLYSFYLLRGVVSSDLRPQKFNIIWCLNLNLSSVIFFS